MSGLVRREREREIINEIQFSDSFRLITDAVRLWRQRIASEADNLGLRHTVLGEGEDGRVVTREVEL